MKREHRDFLDKELQKGDKVIYLGAYSRSLEHGVVVGFTPKMITIKPKGRALNVNRYYHQIIKAEE